MIRLLWLTVILAVIGLIIAFLPTVQSLPTGIEDALEFFVPIWSSWDNVFPITELFVIISMVLVIEAVIMVFHIFDWLFNKFNKG